MSELAFIKVTNVFGEDFIIAFRYGERQEPILFLDKFNIRDLEKELIGFKRLGE